METPVHSPELHKVLFLHSVHGNLETCL